MNLLISNNLFLAVLLLTTYFGVKTNLWLLIWLMMEINTISFIPLILGKKCKYKSESALKYFFTHTIMSMIFIMGIITNLPKEVMVYAMLFSMITKMSMAPLHKWMVGIIMSLSWFNLVILLTIQKILPMLTLFHLLANFNTSLIWYMSTISAIMGSFMMPLQNSLHKMLAYSSVSQTGWLTLAMLNKSSIWWMNFIFYTSILMMLANWFYLSNVLYMNSLLYNLSKSQAMLIIMVILSLAGLPPTLGFIMKLNIINSLVENYFFTLTLILLLSSLVNMYMYLKIMSKLFLSKTLLSNMNVSHEVPSMHMMKITTYMYLLLPAMFILIILWVAW